MTLKEIKNTKKPSKDLSDLLAIIHREGPKDSKLLESLSYFKEFHPTTFLEFEEKIISALGLFYKIDTPDNLYSFLMQGFGNEHKKDHGSILTPVQASIRRAIDAKQYVSISAPTSAGKSYSIRDYLAEGKGDVVIIVPSRALIAEYINSLNRKFENDKNVMISSFVDVIFNERKLRRFFVLTPERSKDLYKFKDKLKIETFFFDEAQISDDNSRGVVFDISVRRVKKHFPNAKIIFAHPFIENPEAQFSKHHISTDVSYGYSYKHGSVGKICIFKRGKKYYYFSPYIKDPHKKANQIEFNGDFRNFIMFENHSILVYVSKSAIYKGDFKSGFEEYISNLPEVKNEKALTIIEDIRRILGADKPGHVSQIVDLLKKGIVIHHGSIPLEVRFLIEDFIRGKHSPLCFATSTLAQGINMPFDVVWIENNRFEGDQYERALAFKNLIGRAGRLTNDKIFDYGYVYTKNIKLFTERIQTPYSLKEESILESPQAGMNDNDQKELIDAIKYNTLDDDKNIPISKVERLSTSAVLIYAKQFLDIFYRNPDSIKTSIGGKSNKSNRDTAKISLCKIYEASIDRQLYLGEINVFNQAIDIFFHAAQGRSFSEIVGLRYSSITNRDNPIKLYAEFSQPAKKLPDASLEYAYGLFPKETPIETVNYDSIIYDTYDYMDQVISFSLSDTLIAAFEIYREKTNDIRAEGFVELLRYNTNNKTSILLLRYGFPSEIVSEIAEHVQTIDENNIVFAPTINNSSDFIKKLVEWYLPQ